MLHPLLKLFYKKEYYKHLKNEIIKICNQIGSDVFLGLEIKNSIIKKKQLNKKI